MSEKAELAAVTAYFGVSWPELNEGLTYHDIVRPTDADSDIKLLNSWLQRIQNKQITIDGKVVFLPDTELRAGAELVYHRLPWREPDAPYLLEVLFEDDYLIVVNKPSGLQVLPGGLYQQRSILTQLQWHACKPTTTSSGCQKTHPVPVHRLGRGTSGILLCAKTKLCKSRLAAYFAEGTSVVEDKQTGLRRVECTQMLPLPCEVEKLFPIDPRLNKNISK
ncbi:hypothetical protein H5410_006266 [Solanum commersonii]|uniref:Pseudouridine synthase RsuA/RluA-like domain-containing protein n=1 Tax=Solanum commersonii TaxID=4109 RepID=A0A9J6A9E4_SOLCO|nr:hypothetical protein H5410_006266 [Solanum commersonii]